MYCTPHIHVYTYAQYAQTHKHTHKCVHTYIHMQFYKHYAHIHTSTHDTQGIHTCTYTPKHVTYIHSMYTQIHLYTASTFYSYKTYTHTYPHTHIYIHMYTHQNKNLTWAVNIPMLQRNLEWGSLSKVTNHEFEARIFWLSSLSIMGISVYCYTINANWNKGTANWGEAWSTWASSPFKNLNDNRDSSTIKYENNSETNVVC